MTREEKISRLKDILFEINENDNAVCYLTSEDNELIESAIEALEQQPCEDAISRDDALMCMTGEFSPAVIYKPEDIISKRIQRIKALPHVQPKIKTGHWIKPKGKVKPFGDDTIQCDMCGFFTDVDCNYNYCPNCGCRMVEPQESESDA